MTNPIPIRYGAAEELQLEISDDALIARGGTPCGEPLEDVSAATAAALATPIDYPPLADATLSSDRVCLVVDRDVPQAASVIAGVVQPLFEAGVRPDQVTVVLAAEFPRHQTVTDELAADVRSEIHVKYHDPCDGNGLAYLATTEQGDSIQINREICDADVVIPICCIRAEGPDGDWGQRGNVFPTFADAKTRERYQAPWEALSQAQREKRKRGREEAAWLLGARMTLQIVSGGGDRVLHIVAGDVDSVALRSRDLASTAWGLEVPQRAGLVVAAIEGEQQQTWENVSRAISSALRVVNDDDAAIVICSELTEMPSPSMIRALIGAEEESVDAELDAGIYSRVREDANDDGADEDDDGDAEDDDAEEAVDAREASDLEEESLAKSPDSLAGGNCVKRSAECRFIC